MSNKQILISPYLVNNSYLRVFGGAKIKSEIEISKFKTVDPK